jgi:hypothetical protein
MRAGLPVTPDELMARLSRLRQAQAGGKRAPHKPLLLLWLFGRLAATGAAGATYAEAEGPVSELINDFGPPAASPAQGRQRAAMPFVHLERDLWELRDRHGMDIPPNVRESSRWLLDHGAAGRLRPEVTAVLGSGATLAAAARLLLDQHFTPVLSELRITVSPLYVAASEPGRAVDSLAGRPLLPVRPGQPSVDVSYVAWHTVQVFKGHGRQAA